MSKSENILVVEDDPRIRRLLEVFLKEYEVTFATCQSEAYDELRMHETKPRFDLVLLDQRLPRHPDDSDPDNKVGIDILLAIRQKNIMRANGQKQIPVVIMTAYAPDDSANVEVIMDNAAQYITKPFDDSSVLLNKIERALTSRPSSFRLHISFHSDKDIVCIEQHEYKGAHYELLMALREPFLHDRSSQRLEENYQWVSKEDLALKLNLEEHAIRQRIYKFRKEIERDLRNKFGWQLDKDDIIENKSWKGYRLNPAFVSLVAWSDTQNGNT